MQSRRALKMEAISLLIQSPAVRTVHQRPSSAPCGLGTQTYFLIETEPWQSIACVSGCSLKEAGPALALVGRFVAPACGWSSL